MPTIETNQIEIVVNGETASVPSGATILDMLRHLCIEPDKVAVELNRAIVRKPDWANTLVPVGAKIEVVQFVGGG